MVIVDTAGRLQIDEQMMQEAVDIKKAVKPDQVLMVVDAMLAQGVCLSLPDIACDEAPSYLAGSLFYPGGLLITCGDIRTVLRSRTANQSEYHRKLWMGGRILS